MKALLTLFAFFAAFIGAMSSIFSMVYDLVQPTVDGPHFAISAISFFLCSVFFLFIRDEVEF